MSAWCRAAISSSPKKFDDPRAYFFQNKDGRIIFAIPYEEEFTLIGTTDQDYPGDPHKACDQRGRDRLSLRCGERIFRRSPSTPEHIVWTYSGVRPLYDDGASKAQEATRDYVLKADGGDGQAPIVNIFGGKITTYRRLSESHAGKDRGFPRQEGQALDRGRAAAGRRFLRPTGFDAQVAQAEGRLSLSRARAMPAG